MKRRWRRRGSAPGSQCRCGKQRPVGIALALGCSSTLVCVRRHVGVLTPQDVYAPIQYSNATGTRPQHQRDHLLLNMPSPPLPTPRPHPLPDPLAPPPASSSSIPLAQLLAPRRRQRPGPLPTHRPRVVLGFRPNPLGGSKPCIKRTAMQDRFARLDGVCLLRGNIEPAPGRHPGRDRHRLAWSTRDRQEYPDPRTIMGMPCKLFFARPAEKINLPSRGHENRQGRHQTAP